MGLPCRASQVGILRLSGKRFEPSVRKNGKFLFQLGYTPVVSDMKKIVQKTAALSFPPMGVSRMGYGYCNIIYGQIRQKSLIFFVYL